MNGPLLFLALFIAILIAANLYRVVTGPTLYDRLVGASMIGTKATLLLVVLGFLFGRVEAFVDLAIVYALLNVVGTIAIGKYLERQPEAAK